MREIKFRAWDNHNKEWVYSNLMPDIGFWKWVAYDSTTVFNEWTGLKDREDVEIYEGDIVQFYRHDDLTHKHEKRHIASIYWANGGFQFADLYNPNRTLASLWNPGESIEVIGNIYENPELLEANQ